MLSGLLETNVSSKQRTFFETLVQGVLLFPETPTLRTIWDVTTHGPERFREDINQLPPNLQNFFWKEWHTYSETRGEAQWRLRGLFNKTHLARMFSAAKTRFDIGEQMQEGKVIVIDNSQVKCTREGCGFLGRFFISQIWLAGTQRHLLPDHMKKPTFVYIDEAHVVIKKDPKIADIIDELRSARIGLVLAHQKLRGQIDDLHVQSSLENCAIKMVTQE